MGHKIVFEDREIGHGGIGHGREGALAIFRDDNIAPPSTLFLVVFAYQQTTVSNVQMSEQPVS